METQTHAFPSDPAGYQPQQGLTKREYFAVLAMQGLLANQATARYVGADLAAVVTESAVQYADALLKELRKSTK